MKYKIHFIDLIDVQKLVTGITKLNFDVNLYDDSRCVDAKSLVAVMNLDLRKSFWIEFVTDENDQIVECQRIVKDLLV